MFLNDYSSESGSYLKIELRNGVSGDNFSYQYDWGKNPYCEGIQQISELPGIVSSESFNDNDGYYYY